MTARYLEPAIIVPTRWAFSRIH